MLGTFLTAAITGLAAAGLFDLEIEGLLVGSIIAATDGAAIFALLRERRRTLKAIRWPSCS